jgi:hypothetical protein
MAIPLVSYLLLPFVQVGFSYYLSVATALMIVMVVRYNRELMSGVVSRPLIFPAMLIIFVPPILTQGALFREDLLVAGRQALMLLLIVGFVAGLEKSSARPARDIRPTRTFIWACLMLGLVFVQSVLLASGKSFIQLPATWYVMNSGTLITDLSLKYSQGNLRPSGTFGEPSYLAFVVLGLCLSVVPLVHSRAARASLILLLVVGLLSRSMAFVISALLVVLLPLVFKRGKGNGLVLLAVAAAVPVFAFTKAGSVLDRLSTAGDASRDASVSARIWAPLDALPRYLLDNPIGLPISSLEKILPYYWPTWLPYSEGGLNNALLSTFYQFGLFAVVILATIFTATRNWQMRMFLICAMMFNGSFLSIDKAAIVALVSAGYFGARRLNKQFLLDAQLNKSLPRLAIPAGGTNELSDRLR